MFLKLLIDISLDNFVINIIVVLRLFLVRLIKQPSSLLRGYALLWWFKGPVEIL